MQRIESSTDASTNLINTLTFLANKLKFVVFAVKGNSNERVIMLKY